MDLPLTFWLRRGRFHPDLGVKPAPSPPQALHLVKLTVDAAFQGTGLTYPVMQTNTGSAQTNLHGSNRKRKPVNLYFPFMYEYIYLDIMKTIQTLINQGFRIA